ncbi:hypothetical protein ID866_6550 [Astraeus odoratus]|nr:hypothetical protein ID866_6550 [Astraeus odoratus]
MRLSSPTYDDQVESLSQDAISAFDAANALLTQPSSSFCDATQTPKPIQPDHASRLADADELPRSISDEEENPFLFEGGESSSANAGSPREVTFGALFTKATAFCQSGMPISEAEDAMDDGAPPENVYSSWFESSTTTPLVGFKTATTALQNGKRGLGGANEGDHSECLLIPSASALSKAKEKMKLWQDEDEAAIIASQQPIPTEPTLSVGPGASRAPSPPMPSFASASKAFSVQHTPETPIPPARTRATAHGKHPKPFKTPLLTATTSSPLQNSAIANMRSPSISADRSFVPPSPLLSLSTESLPAPQRPLGFTPSNARSAAKPKFVTPFKAGIRSGVQNSTTLKAPTPLRYDIIASAVYPPSTTHLVHEEKPTIKHPNENERRSLASSALKPQSYTVDELEGFGINIKELKEINPRTAISYSFHTKTATSNGIPGSSMLLDYAAALKELHATGCTLATKSWVENHWGLILWKLAGMAALDPKTESDSSQKRWCWSEVIRQLRYRYERDLNGSSRPPLRLVVTRDASSESPMILCVSNIVWPAGTVDENDQPVAQHPELEVTDGWYRLRAQIDAPLARATRKGIIKIGRKISIAGARLSSQRKEGSEILEAYDSTVLILFGNSSHMAPWHAKLGFQKEPFIATLNSLTSDGGNVAVMAIEIVKAHPVAFIEFVEDERGRTRSEGPRNAKEESQLQSQWERRRESNAAKLWATYEKRWSTMSNYAERLKDRAQSKLVETSDIPDNVHDLYDALKEDPATANRIMSSISSQDAVWLSRHIEERTIQEREEAGREIERELDATFPLRDVRDFCVLVIKDAYTSRRPPNRTAQLTAWGAVGLTSGEGFMKGFEKGQRFLVCFTSSTGNIALTYARSPI